MAQFNVRVDDRELRSLLRAYKRNVGRVAGNIAKAGAFAAAAEMRRLRSGPVTKRRTGRLAASYRARKVQETGRSEAWSAGVVDGPPYARIQEFGGVIRPRKARFLAIPIAPEARGRRPRSFRGTFVSKGVIFKKRPLKALYVLKRQVRIPARPVLPRGAERGREVIRQRLRSLVASDLAELNR